MPVLKVYDSSLSQWVDVGASGSSIDWSNPIPVTGATTLTIGRHHVCSGTSADYTVTLPAVSGNAGKLLSVEMSGALTKLVTLDGNASETIDGATTRIMWARETAILLCDGTQWTKVGGKSIPMGVEMRNSAAQLWAGGVQTKVITNSVIVANPSALADTANNRVSILRPAFYQVSSSVTYSATNTTANQTQNRMWKNGTVYRTSAVSNNPSVITTAVLSSTEPFLAGDYIEMYSMYSGGLYAIECIYANGSYLIVREIPSW